MSDNPEQPVVDAIAALVDEQLNRGQQGDGYDEFPISCPHCCAEWHGEPSIWGCPGALAQQPPEAYVAIPTPKQFLAKADPASNLTCSSLTFDEHEGWHTT